MCADKQSTDWFHSISRTLKWNERERQKSFVVVEEGPAQPRKRTKRGTPEQLKVVNPPTPEATVEDEDEDEDEVSDEEEEGFDIDDSSPEAEANPPQLANGAAKAPAPVPVPVLTPRMLGVKKDKDARRRASKSRSRSRPGVDSPGRFSAAHPVPPVVSPRHVEFALARSDSSASEGGYFDERRVGRNGVRDEKNGFRDGVRDERSMVRDERNGTRDDLHSPRSAGTKSRIPKERENDVDSGKTPTLSNAVYARPRGHSRSQPTEQNVHRAFAVWGHDDSDSNASDSDV